MPKSEPKAQSKSELQKPTTKNYLIHAIEYIGSCLLYAIELYKRAQLKPTGDSEAGEHSE